MLLAAARQPTVDIDGLSSFCQDIFGSLTRSDQRRWGEVYLRGLLTVHGRKTIRSISEHVVGEPVDQCLQQFVNQSPWRWEPVRETVAHWATGIQPRALVVNEVVFPKTGTSSVGVARQFAGPAGRILNCQLGLAVFLVGKHAACAVNWRLMLPRSWDNDSRRRSRSRIPDTEQHRPRAEHVLLALDELAMGVGHGLVPVIVDSFQEDAQQLVRGLAERGIPYLVRIPAHTPVLPTGQRVITAAELAAPAAIRQVVLPSRSGPDAPPAVVRYSDAPVCEACLAGAPGFRCARGHGRRLLAEWAPGERRLRAVWLTNLTRMCPHELVSLTRLARVEHQVVSTLRNDFGLHDFEGRSFGGWHHHVTLVSAAHILWTLRRLREKGEMVTPAQRPGPEQRRRDVRKAHWGSLSMATVR